MSRSMQKQNSGHGRRQLIVVGNGMVGHRFVDLMITEGPTDEYQITVLGEEPRPAYDRVGLSVVLRRQVGRRPVAGRARTSTSAPASPSTVGDAVTPSTAPPRP